jgi:hypothetical protein
MRTSETTATLQDFAAELRRHRENSRDYIADSRQITVEVDGTLNAAIDATEARASKDKPRNAVRLALSNGAAFPMRPHAERQLAERLKIPAAYFERMRDEAPDMLARDANQWLRQQPEQRMIRTLDNNARAYLSRRYRRIDNLDLAEAALDGLSTVSEMQISSQHVDAERLYLRATFPRIQGQVNKVGDVVQAGVSLRNSEVGDGTLEVAPLIFVLRCTNGAIVQDGKFRAMHLGRSLGDDNSDTVRELFSDKTNQLDDAALWHKVRDVMRAVATPDSFQRLLDLASEAAQQKISGEIPAIVTLATRELGVPNARASVLQHLIEGHDLSRWGLSNALTAAAQDNGRDFRAGADLEEAGGRVLTLAPAVWTDILAATEQSLSKS